MANKRLFQDDMPIPQRNLFNLILRETNGNISAFAKKVECSQQMLDMCFKPDKSTGKYRSIYPSIKNAVMQAYGFDEGWFFRTDENEEQTKEVPTFNNNEFWSVLKSLTDANAKHAQANLINAEANMKNAVNIENLINMLNK